MRWTKKEKRHFSIGDQRVKKRFLIIPKCLPEGGYGGAEKQWRWLERSRIVQEITSKYYLPIFGNRNNWENISWGD